MSNYIDPYSAVEVSSFIAADIQASANGIVPQREQLASVISEVQLQTQILGASLLHVTIIDPGWAILRTGWLNVTADGLLDEIEVEFPKGQGMWWRLAMVEGGNDLTQPNLTLTFQDRIVAYLQDKTGPIGVAPGTTTRAQFIKQLVDQVGQGDGLMPITFVCPELNQLQPVQSTTNTLGQTAVLNTITAQNQSAKVNKTGGLGNGAKVTIKGIAPTTQQVNILNQALHLAVQLSAPPLAVQALVEALIQESSVTNLPPGLPGEGTSSGVLQFESTTAATLGIDPMNPVECVTAFLQDHYYTQPGVNYGPSPGGAIATATANPTFTADQIAQATQGSAFPTAYGQWANEAKAIIQAAGGVSTLTTISPPTDVSQLTRGTSDNPDENSWDCGQRLATEVNWSLFSNGNTFYYMDGPDLMAQKPAVYLSLDATGTTWTATNPTDGDTATDVVSNLTFTFDNTAFAYQETHTRKGKIQRKTGVKTPQTPSQVKMNMICGILDYFAGDVFVFQNSGVIDGRWIVEDATRNCLADRFTQFTLGPPVLPDNEPAATTAGAALSGQTPAPSASSSNSAGATPGAPGTPGNTNSNNPNATITDPAIPDQGTGVGVAQAALQALNDQTQYNVYRYSEALLPVTNGWTPRSNGGTLFGPSPRTMDCSSFATLCYKAAGLPDPNHMGYAQPNLGNTSSLIAHCTPVSAGAAQPGCLCFYGPSTSETVHVTVYIGNGNVISMGKQGDPETGPAATTGPAGFLGYFQPDVPSTPIPPPSPPPSLWNNPSYVASHAR